DLPDLRRHAGARSGKSDGPGHNDTGPGQGLIEEGEQARKAVADAQRQTTARQSLAKNPNFEQISPEVGRLDEDALRDLLDRDPDQALTMLAELTGTTDPVLRSLARQLAGRIMVDVARTGRADRGGIGRLRRARAADGGDLDLDASIEPLADSRAAGEPPSLDDLWVRKWGRPMTALCLVVDRSGSMAGQRLATMAVAAAAVAFRQGDDDYSVISFARDAVVVKAQGEHRPVERVVDDVLSLRGHGVTDLALALQAARRQLERSNASHKVTIVLSDGRATAGNDPLGQARHLDTVHVLAPSGDAEEAILLARAGNGSCVEITVPTDAPAAIAALLA
ncbi:MAG: VWA domain-containing protein, partial [Actinobacteria bacterium]|nr:VWA domain-containing protein [Actinomycetota bacterium]